MKLFDKVKSLFSKQQGDGNHRSRVLKYAGFVMLGIGNVVAITMATIAWFGLSNKQSKIAMVSGDLDVEINTVTAYKYVYPYYKNSTEFIDYDSEGVVKKYILEDHTLEFDGDDIDDISITSDNATITLGVKAAGTSTTNQNNAAYNNIYIPAEEPPATYAPEFRYYLIGDDKFSGVTNTWSLTDGYAFSSTDDIVNDKTTVLDNLVISAGSSFRLVEAYEYNYNFTYNYFPLNSINSGSAFRIVDENDDQIGDTILCLRSGIYTITYSANQLSIVLRTTNAGAKKDISVITNNSLDPTKISIDYAGSVNKTTYPTIESYLSPAIYDQNTMVILDVELNFKNANPVEVGLQVERTNATSNSIYNLASKYEDTTHNLNGYIDANHQNMLRASDFYNFYATFTKTPYANANAIWTALHREGDNQSQKYANDETYDKTIDCTLNLKEQNDSAIIPGVNPDSGVGNVYHCYIGIDYDYEHCSYFLNKNRLGKTYMLDRDFGFHFFGVQHREDAV